MSQIHLNSPHVVLFRGFEESVNSQIHLRLELNPKAEKCRAPVWGPLGVSGKPRGSVVCLKLGFPNPADGTESSRPLTILPLFA